MRSVVGGVASDMSLTEVVYKIRSEAFPLCALTKRSEDLRMVFNHQSWDPTTGTGRGVLSILGAEDAQQEVLDVLPDIFGDVQVLDSGSDEANVQVSLNLKRMQASKNPAAFTLRYFGDDGILEPTLIKEGYLFSRLLVPGEVDLAEMLEEYEKGVEEGWWDDFKLVRIEDFHTEQQTHGAFAENLTQKQLEVIKTGLALGFYNTPRDITLDDLSSIFGISKAAVHNRLQAAERKVISKFFS